MAASISLVSQRFLVPPSHSFESISSSQAPSPAPSVCESPSSSPTPAASPIVLGTASSTKSSINARSFLPKSTLKTPSSSSGQYVNQLLRYRELFHKREFWEEVAILERLYYKNKSQHRQAVHFQRMHECRRLVSRIRDLRLAGIVDELVRDFYSGRSLRIIRELTWDSVPTRQSVAFVMTRIVGQILLLQKMQTILYKVYGSFYQLMSKTQFMSFALIAIGLVSRLSIMAKLWSQELVDCYKMLQKWINDFPQGDRLQLKDIPDYEKELPKNIDDFFQKPVPEVPQAPVVQEGQEKQQQLQPLQQTRNTVGDIDDSLLDLGEVIKRPTIVVKATSAKSSSVSPITASPVLHPTREDLVARKDPTTVEAGSMVTKAMEQDILSELGGVFSSSSSTVKTKAKAKGTTMATTTESKIVKVKVGADVSSMDDVFGSLEDKIKKKAKKKQKQMLTGIDAQRGSMSQEERSDTSTSATPIVRSEASSRAPTPPTPEGFANESGKDATAVQAAVKEPASKESCQGKANTKPKAPSSSLLSNFDDIFGNDSLSVSGKSTVPSSPGGSGGELPMKKKKQKALPPQPKRGKDEIDDLFGSMTPKSKKPKLNVSAEIDSIFGLSKKKKKKSAE